MRQVTLPKTKIAHKKSYKRKRAYKRGVWAEYGAAAYFILKGYKLLKWRYKTPGGEIDLILSKGSGLVFVEVKSRCDQRQALESITAKNRARIEKAASYFLFDHSEWSNASLRFDVFTHSGLFSFQHLDNAWEVRS